MMKKIYEIGGSLNKGFVGQISYTICLDQDYSNMDLAFTFDPIKQRFQKEEINRQIIQEFTEACNGEYGIEKATEAEITDTILGNCKTEIHTIAYMNDVFIGGIHKQLSERHMIYQPGFASEGCIPQPSIHGVIKLTLVVFNVIKNDTKYTVSLSVE